MSDLDRKWIALPRDLKQRMADLLAQVARVHRLLVDAENEEAVAELLKAGGLMSLEFAQLHAQALGVKVELVQTGEAIPGGQVGFRIDGREGGGT